MHPAELESRPSCSSVTGRRQAAATSSACSSRSAARCAEPIGKPVGRWSSIAVIRVSMLDIVETGRRPGVVQLVTPYSAAQKSCRHLSRWWGADVRFRPEADILMLIKQRTGARKEQRRPRQSGSGHPRPPPTWQPSGRIGLRCSQRMRRGTMSGLANYAKCVNNEIAFYMYIRD